MFLEDKAQDIYVLLNVLLHTIRYSDSHATYITLNVYLKVCLPWRIKCVFWPRRLACAMHAPCVAWPLLLPSFSLFLFFFAQAACLRHACAMRACVRHAWLGHCYHHRSVFLSFALSSFFLCFLLLTHFGESPMCEIISPPIFWHN